MNLENLASLPCGKPQPDNNPKLKFSPALENSGSRKQTNFNPGVNLDFREFGPWRLYPIIHSLKSLWSQCIGDRDCVFPQHIRVFTLTPLLTCGNKHSKRATGHISRVIRIHIGHIGSPHGEISSGEWV